ncbi:MAG: ATP-binding cassette domain-containing protein [Verrucomicrobiota bacterium]|nr:ATP-binding cassette domain-containing protein [Verrucomicrobiota bacterium]
MLELREVSVVSTRAATESRLLNSITAHFAPGQLHAVVGPSGCGKSTLLKAIAGVQQPNEGGVFWAGRDLDRHDLAPNEIGYVPQFGIAFDLLTVAESVATALSLRVGGLSEAERAGRTARFLSEVGLTETGERRVGVLSGGQKRRLALALELVSEPHFLLCDEVTSGLDPKSEGEIVHLLHHLAKVEQRTVISVTHSLRHLELHDTVTVLYEGRLVYQAAPSSLGDYFQIDNPELLFPTLGMRTAEEWEALWQAQSSQYAPRAAISPNETKAPPTEDRRPDFLAQFFILLRRRWLLFFRNRGQLALQLALLFGFPCLVVIFAWGGLPQIQNLAGSSANALQQLVETTAFALQSDRVGSLVSGLIMFQVILLTLMGSNNAAREIAGERAIFEKEKFAGIRPASYIASKIVFLSVLIVAQSAWMGFFVSLICRFPGDLLAQILILCLTNSAMTFVCLAISSLSRSSENASLLSVYLVGLQLPLSGAVLALPHVLGLATRPFIAAYWGWSGYWQTMRETRFYDFVQSMSATELVAFELCAWVLLMHVVGGILVAYLGAKNSRWE